MRKDVQSQGAPTGEQGEQVAGPRGSPGGHEVAPAKLTLMRQQAEVDEYSRTLLSLLADAQLKASESTGKGGPNFVPVRDPKGGALYLVASDGTQFEFNTRDPADMAHFKAAMARVKLEPAEVVSWADTVSSPLRALLGPMGDPNAGPGASQPGQSMLGHSEFINRLKQARTPAEADAIVAEHPLFGDHPEAANLPSDDPLSQRLTDEDGPHTPIQRQSMGFSPLTTGALNAPPPGPSVGAQHNTFMRGQQQQFNQALPPQPQRTASNPFRR
jgi:hypothetical protein